MPTYSCKHDSWYSYRHDRSPSSVIPVATTISGNCRVSVVFTGILVRQDGASLFNKGCIMNTNNPPRLLTNLELGVIVAFYREMKGWSQETLAELSGISVRTVQRVEHGQGAVKATRRALANAFGIEDIDLFNKAMEIPTAEELAREKEEFDRQFVRLKTIKLTSGKQLVDLAYKVNARLFTADDGQGENVDLVVAELQDLFSDFCDIKEEYSGVERLDMAREFQIKIDLLASLGVGLCYGLRKARLKGADEASQPLQVGIAYVLAKANDDLPEEMVVQRAISLGL